MTNDPIADLFTRIRNASRAGHPTVNVPASTTKRRILDLLLAEGYIDRIEDFADSRGHKNFKVYLRYTLRGTPVLRELSRVSRPGKRVYIGKDEIRQFRGGLGLYVISTSKGMLSDKDAKAQGVGGELIANVF